MKYLTHALIFLLGGLLAYCGTEHFKPMPEVVEIEKEVIKEKIVTQEKEVVKWKAQKDKIVYRTKFDTLATIDTVYIELIKCDSIGKIDSSLIASQDTIIVDQKKLIANCEANTQVLKKEIKKEKRKGLLTKIGAGIIIFLTIIAVK
jgi:hypothetical protein